MDRQRLVVVGAGAQAPDLLAGVVAAEHDDRHVGRAEGAPDVRQQGPRSRSPTVLASSTTRCGASSDMMPMASSTLRTKRSARSVAPSAAPRSRSRLGSSVRTRIRAAIEVMLSSRHPTMGPPKVPDGMTRSPTPDDP